MAKFCNQCGFQAEDDAVACEKCGNPLEMIEEEQKPREPKMEESEKSDEIASPEETKIDATEEKTVAEKENEPEKESAAPVLPEQETETAQKHNVAGRRKKIKRFFIVIAAVLVMMSALSIAVNFVGWRGTARKFMTAYEEYDLETITALAIEGRYGTNKEMLKEHFGPMITYTFDRFEEEVGPDFKLHYKIVDHYDLRIDKYKRLLEECQVDDTVITDAIVIEIELTAKGDRTMSIPMSITLAKEKGVWKLYDVIY